MSRDLDLENSKGHTFKWETRDQDLNSTFPVLLHFGTGQAFKHYCQLVRDIQYVLLPLTIEHNELS